MSPTRLVRNVPYNGTQEGGANDARRDTIDEPEGARQAADTGDGERLQDHAGKGGRAYRDQLPAL